MDLASSGRESVGSKRRPVCLASRSISSLRLPDRATIGNMAPEYGATMGFFPVDSESVNYLRMTGRSEETIDRFEKYFQAQQLFGMPKKGTIDYSVDLDLDLSSVQPSVAGPKRPQDRVDLELLGQTFHSLLSKPAAEGGYGKDPESLAQKVNVYMNGTQPTSHPEQAASL